MRTTLILDERVMKRLKALAAQRGQTLSSLVDALLRQGLERERTEIQEIRTADTDFHVFPFLRVVNPFRA